MSWPSSDKPVDLVDLVDLVQINIYQNNVYRKNFSWQHFDDGQRVQDRQQMKDQQSCISVFVAYVTISSSS